MANYSNFTQLLPDDFESKVLSRGRSGIITAITSDSRQSDEHSVFVALLGSRVNGHDYINQAVERGCRNIVIQENVEHLPPGITVVQVADSQQALGVLCSALHDHPSRKMTMVAITGTNGKTTVSWLIEKMLAYNRCRVGVVGTVNYRYPGRDGRMIVAPSSLTTPGPEYLQRLLCEMATEGVTHVVMETSSHALAQHRIAGILFDVCVFTNLSRDHLDFHDTMEEYFKAKQLLFAKYLKKQGKAVVVTDEKQHEAAWAGKLARDLRQHLGRERVLSCAVDGQGFVGAKKVQQDVHGFSCTLQLGRQEFDFSSSLIGRFNVLNVLAAAGVGVALALDNNMIVSGLARVKRVPGRLERISLAGVDEGQGAAVFVDYAHTPDALENVLKTLKEVTRSRLICIFGCGGDRDQGKRLLMGRVAATCADVAIITSDNPRSEDPEAIIEQIAEGFHERGCTQLELSSLSSKAVPDGCLIITDRKMAIAAGYALAGSDDIVLVAGKGHEDYQIIGSEKKYFDDRVEAANAVMRWNTTHLLRATGGRVVSGHVSCLLTDVSTDTRNISSGNIFVALAGAKFDGHDYVHRAVEAAAGAILIHRDVQSVPQNILVIRVADTEQALGDLAAYRRRILGKELCVAAITGSSGKTTVKEMTAAIFIQYAKAAGQNTVLKTEGNFNNLIGLPLSLLPVTASHHSAILEMGMNRPGEIERLTGIADPDIGCITNIQSAHLEGLGNIEGVALAKGELFAGMRPDGVAVMNFDDPLVRKLPVQPERRVSFAITPSGRRRKPTVRATRINNLGELGMRFTLHINDWQKRITISVPGEHNVSNCAAAAAIAHAAGIDGDSICEGLIGFQNVDKRMQFMTLPGGVHVLNDCYNANPDSMAASLRTVSTFGKDCRRVALLGDMLELGSGSDAAHVDIGRRVARLGYDSLAVLGNFASHVVSGALEEGFSRERIFRFGDTLEVAAWLYDELVQGRLGDGDWLLVKGSRGMQMEKSLQELQRRFATGIGGEE